MKIVLADFPSPRDSSPKAEMEWLCASLGLIDSPSSSSPRRKTAASILSILLASSFSGRGASIDSLCGELSLSRTAVRHHLSRLSERGLVEKRGRSFFLRRATLFETVSRLRHESDFIFSRLLDSSRAIDVAFAGGGKKVEVR